MSPDLSVVVVAHDMGRELPRTIRSLGSECQRGVDPTRYEILVVDNGSPTPVDPAIAALAGAVPVGLERIDPAPPSPARAANLGVARASGRAVGLIVDGARMASPGLVAAALDGLTRGERTVVATLGWHLGPGRHGDPTNPHTRESEDELLDTLGWPEDGYRLFEVSTLAHSSSRGWFGPMGESSALFMPRLLWDELGGLDEAFALPGGGLVNHDLYRRAVEAVGPALVVLLGEGTFHQVHGGAATSGRFGWEEMQADHEQIRGHRYAPPEVDPVYLGRVPPSARRHLEASLTWARDHPTGPAGAVPARRFGRRRSRG